MKSALLTAVLVLTVPLSALAQRPAAPRSPSAARPSAAAPATDHVADAYEQFLLGHRLEQGDDVSGAIVAYKRAMELDPLAADVPAQLAGLYLRQNRVADAISAAEQAIKAAPLNREAHRVLGIAYASTIDARNGQAARNADDNLAKAIEHLEIAIDGLQGESDPNIRATLARLYNRAGSYTKSIPVLTDLVRQEPGWQEGPILLLEAYLGAGRVKDAITWLEEATADDPRLLPSLGELYERERRWKDAATAYGAAVERSPRNIDLKARYAGALMNAGGRSDVAKAREMLQDVISARPADARSLYLVSQAERRLGNARGAEQAARRVIELQARSPWGYYALAEALEERRDYAGVVEALTPAVASFRTAAASGQSDLGLLLPHLGFAYQELGTFDKAIAIFEEARKLAPTDPALTGYLIEANLAAKRYTAAADLARNARAGAPNDLRFAQLEARALRQSGKSEQGVTLLEGVVRQHMDEPAAYVALAQLYADASRGADAVKLLVDAGTKFPSDSTISFELGTVFDKQKKFAEAEAAFQKVLSLEPENAAALNYIGYMLAERGERLDESVTYLQKALALEPNNGSFLDSIGWAYYKANKLELAESNLKRAADQLQKNSVIQDHYGDLLFKLGRYSDAISAWNRALAGDSDSIDRTEIDKKVRAAKKLVKK
jgi:tetratricopeptide (TPR) repeat protein